MTQIKMEIKPFGSAEYFKIKQEPPWEHLDGFVETNYANQFIQIKQKCTHDFVLTKQGDIKVFDSIKEEQKHFDELHLSENKPNLVQTGNNRISVILTTRMSRYSSWNRPQHRNSNYNRNRPHGLRGREIGLFYRDRQIKKTKIRNFTINLTIPTAVLSSLQINLDAIIETAKELHIKLPPTKTMNLIKLKQEKSEFHYDPSELDFQPINVRNFVKLHRESSPSETPSTSANCMLADEDQVMEPKEDPKVKTEQGEENVKTELTDDAEMEQCRQTPSKERRNSLRGAGDYKYGYEDIITGTFEEKLEKCISEGIIISMNNHSNQILNKDFHESYQTMIQSRDYKKMKSFRETLPTYKKSKELLELINNNQVIVISGETGCGKSTQIPQIILDDAMLNKRGANVHILVTQPRRIAASSLAMRVAEERSEPLGVSIGYAVRLESVDPRPRGSIKFCTTGILLAELEINQGLTNYSHVILDEVHERDCHIDISMLMLKQVLKQRKDLKLILMSATIDAETLTSYFDDCPMMQIEGIAYPVKDIYLEDILNMMKYVPCLDHDKGKVKRGHNNKLKKMESEMQWDIKYKAEIAPWLESIKKQLSRDVYTALQDYRIEHMNIGLIYELLVYICKGDPGAILVFLPGISDITKLFKKINESSFFPKSHFEVYPLHSKLPSLEQHRIFQRPPEHVRKIILATNIAETSITIDDIVYVVDCGRMKYSGLNVQDNVATLQTEWISQANLRQRRGRAGRCQPGICYHLLTSYRASKLEERLSPEIQRNSLLEPVLTIKRMRLGKAIEAMNMMPSPPAQTTMEWAIKHLSQIGALDSEEKLTPLGWHLARLPVHPCAGKLLLLGSLFGCLNRAASVAAVWGFKDPFQIAIGKEKEMDDAKRALALGEPSDHVAISEAIIQFENCRTYHEKRNFAYENFLALNTLELLCDMKKQLGYNLKQMGFLDTPDVTSAWENRNENNMSLFKAIIAASLYPNIGTVKWRKLNSRKPSRFRIRTPEDGAIILHPSSVMALKMYKGWQPPSTPVCTTPGANWLVYWLKQRSTDLFLIDVTMVFTLPFLFFGELVVSELPDTSNYCILISSVKVICDKTTMDLLWQMRSLLDHVLASKIDGSNKHGSRLSPFEIQVLDAVMEIITAEDERAEFIGDDDSESDCP